MQWSLLEIHPLTALHHKTDTGYEKCFYLKSKYQADTCKTTYKVELRGVPCPGCLRAPQIQSCLPEPEPGTAPRMPGGGKGGALTVRWPDPHTGLKVPGGQWASSQTRSSAPRHRVWEQPSRFCLYGSETNFPPSAPWPAGRGSFSGRSRSEWSRFQAQDAQFH